MSPANNHPMPISRDEIPWLAEYDALVDCRQPALIGVRHHSAILARALPRLLDELDPSSLLIELPSDLAEWLPYLADPDTVAPVALSAATEDGSLFFYPLADFSPELVAIRWAHQHGVPLVPCDLAVGRKARPLDSVSKSECDLHSQNASPAKPPESSRLFEQLLDRYPMCDSGDLWQRLVEAPGIEQAPEAVRRAGLLFGWTIRAARCDLDRPTALREAAMRETIRQAPQGSVALVGAFHAPALLPAVVEREQVADRERLAATLQVPIAISLVPYSFEQLDERSGYPAGIRDPAWHQAVVQCDSSRALEAAAGRMVTSMCRELRRAGHAASTPDAIEMMRWMKDLARLRGLAAPGRSELLESIETCLLQGDLFGRGQAVARAAEKVLIGRRRGTVTSAVPPCGLDQHLRTLLKQLRLPGPDDSGMDPKVMDLDPLRNPRDRARIVVFQQMRAAGIDYARRIDTEQQGMRENIRQRWQVQWNHTTSALVAAAARHGVTLAQAADRCIRLIVSEESDSTSVTYKPEVILRRLRSAALCGLHRHVDAMLARLNEDFLVSADISQLVEAADYLARIGAGLVEGLPIDPSLAYPPIVRTYRIPSHMPTIAPLMTACLDRLDGLAGSERADDVSGLVDLVYWFTGDLLKQYGTTLEMELDGALRSATFRLAAWCREAEERGSQRMRGAAAGILGILEPWTSPRFAALTEGWFDGADDREGRRRLRFGLAGASQVLSPLMQNDPQWLDGLERRLSTTDDQTLLARLPALRGGFSELSPADRRRILLTQLSRYQERRTTMAVDVEDGLGGATSSLFADPSALYAARREADLAGQRAVENSCPRLWNDLAGHRQTAKDSESPLTEESEKHGPTSKRQVAKPHSIPIADRWRLVLGIAETASALACRAAAALDELYGRGRGEGRRGELRGTPGGGGGTESPSPRTIDWADDLEELFGKRVCQEVLGESLTRGRAAAAELLDAEEVTPSVEWLQQVLALAAEMPERQAEKLRRLAKKITQRLADELANRLRPALAGLSTPRPTSRPTRRLDLSRTIRRNLSHAYRRGDGRPSVIAQRMVFHAPACKQMDWHLTFVVDVSSSMSPSVIYSAVVAAIFCELPAVSVRFLAFSTEVIDLTSRVADPLTLLLKVQVGGGTRIGLGLRAAREGIRNPTRSLVVLVSDFEEGASVGEMLSEVRALVDSGVKCLGLAALDDSGTARFHEGYARLVASTGMPVAAVSPEELTRWVSQQLRD